MLCHDDHDPFCLGIRKWVGASVRHPNGVSDTDPDANTNIVDNAFAISLALEQPSDAGQQRIGYAMPLAQRDADVVPDADPLPDWHDADRLGEREPEGLGLALTQDRVRQHDRSVAGDDLCATQLELCQDARLG